MAEPKKKDETALAITNPQVLLSRMVETKTDPDALKKYMDLVERWTAQQAIVAFNEAMTECQQEMPAVVRNAVNSHSKKSYADLEAVNEAIKPIYTSAGFAVTYTETQGAPAGMVRVQATLSHRAGHIAPPYVLDVPLDGKGAQGNATQMNPLQAKGSTISYARRYLLHMIFNLTVAGEDNDGAGPANSLTQDQIAVLNGLLEEIKAYTEEPVYRRFMDWMRPDLKASGDSNLGDVPQEKYESGRNWLTKKLGVEKAKAGAGMS